MKLKRAVSPLLALMFAASFAGPAAASLTTFQVFHGNVGYSSDGFGSTTQNGTISANVPVGSTVLAAYLYTATWGSAGATDGDGTTLNGTAVNFGAQVVNLGQASLASRRADVTAIVAAVINGGLGGVYNFSLSETSALQDGESLVVVYSNGSLAESTFAILDGFSASAGDTTTVNFADPLDPNDPGFFAEMFLGIGFSADGVDCTGSSQVSSVGVNGTTITNNAGCNDDSIDGTSTNGNLLTTGGYDDPHSALLPATADDHERYDLQPYITLGDTSIQIDTFNASNDDNIFLAGFYVLGNATINQVPEPSSLALLGLGISGMGLLLLRRRRDKVAQK